MPFGLLSSAGCFAYLYCPQAAPHPAAPRHAAELLQENEGAVLGSVLLETTTQGLRRLSTKALQALGNWLSPSEPA